MLWITTTVDVCTCSSFLLRTTKNYVFRFFKHTTPRLWTSQLRRRTSVKRTQKNPLVSEEWVPWLPREETRIGKVCVAIRNSRGDLQDWLRRLKTRSPEHESMRLRPERMNDEGIEAWKNLGLYYLFTIVGPGRIDHKIARWGCNLWIPRLSCNKSSSSCIYTLWTLYLMC